MASGGFRLRKWKTNDKQLRDRIAEQEKNGDQKVTSDEQTYAQLTLGSEVSDNCHKVLGLPWDCVKDEIRFSFIQLVSKASRKFPTKRSVLSLKTSFEKNCFSAWASTLNMGLINKVDMVCLSPVGYGV